MPVKPSSVALTTWRYYKRASLTANRLKAARNRWRTAVFGLAMAGAFLETLAVQLGEGAPAHQGVAIVGAIFLSLIPLISGYALRQQDLRLWISMRSLSEALKHQLFKYRVGALEYAGGDPDDTLARALMDLTSEPDEILRELEMVEVPEPGGDQLGPLTIDGYAEERVGGQIEWYRKSARFNLRWLKRSRWGELAFSVLAALIGIFASANTGLDMNMWVAVVTTFSATLAAHVAASRFDYLATTYSATARHLERELCQWRVLYPKGGASEPAREAIDRFVGNCERAISVENQSWMVEWRKRKGKEAVAKPG